MAEAQTTRGEATQPAPPPPAKPAAAASFTIQPPPTRLQRIFGPTATTGGAVPDLRRNYRSVLSRTGPAANSATNFQNVAVNPHTGKAEGISLFAIKF
jgi:hypothetical protein